MAYGTNEGNWDFQGNSWQGESGGNGHAWDGQRLSLREAWAGYEMPSGMQLWAGKRYYQRKDIHIMDWYYINNSGTGIGLENIDTGLGSVSVALLKQQVDTELNTGEGNDVNSWKLDARWNGIPLWTDGSLDIALIYAWQNLSENQKKAVNDNRFHGKGNNAFLATVELTQGNFFGGFNKVVLQYGHDGFDGVGTIAGGNHAGDTVNPYSEKGNGFRFIDWGVIEQPSWNLGYVFMATHRNAYDENHTEGGANWAHPTGNDYNFVIRPAYKWSDFTSTVLEFGYANFAATGWNGFWTNEEKGTRGWNTNPDGTKARNRLSATKLTIAQQWTPGSHFWARPSIRVFASWYAGDFMNKLNTGIADQNHEFVLGGQVEAWW